MKRVADHPPNPVIEIAIPAADLFSLAKACRVRSVDANTEELRLRYKMLHRYLMASLEVYWSVSELKA